MDLLQASVIGGNAIKGQRYGHDNQICGKRVGRSAVATQKMVVKIYGVPAVVIDTG